MGAARGASEQGPRGASSRPQPGRGPHLDAVVVELVDAGQRAHVLALAKLLRARGRGGRQAGRTA